MNPPRIAVITLCHPKHTSCLGARAASIKKHLQTPTGYDHIIFEDVPLSSPARESVTAIFPMARFINVWDNAGPRLLESCNKNKLIQYRGMCLFYAMEFLRYLEDYDYIIRIDADSLLHSTLDISEFITGGATHGYIRDKKDTHGPTCKTLPPAIERYVVENKIKTLCGPEGISCCNFYSNFGIMKASFWRSPSVTQFLDFIYNEGGIKNHRWGDSTIQGNALRMFCPPDGIIKLDFKYEHGSHRFKNF